VTKTSYFFAAAVAALSLTACDKGSDKAASNAPIEQVKAPNGDWSAVVTETPEGGFLMGNPNAKVKLVEFGSMTCPHCREFDEEAMGPLTETFVKSGQVSFEFRNFVRDGADLTASLVARCNGPAGFFGLTRQLYADQPNWIGKLQTADPATLQRIDSLPPTQKPGGFAELLGLGQWASMRGLPAAKANACLADQSAIDRLVAMQTEAVDQYQIPGTPSFLIDGKMVELDNSATVWKQLEAKLRDAI
jgi:protein-disulfide isomerase